MTATGSRTSVSDSILFGDVLVTRTDERVTARLASDDSVVVTIERRGPRTRKNVPIGTRAPHALTARVNEREITVTPGRGTIFKRTYRILVDTGDRFLSIRPKTIDTCEFVAGRPHETEKTFGELRALPDGRIDISWAATTTIPVLGKTVVPPEPTAEDVLIGCALAAAFGTGALSLTAIVTGLVAAAIPG
ncbi:hypothetical protein [Nocardia nova]|uniref:hypothetical protein n=1 Tax=Nocardia nova TaxID=37330 RepID=UPI00046CA906|nr:hypothetical protein [Nocardia nova]